MHISRSFVFLAFVSFCLLAGCSPSQDEASKIDTTIQTGQIVETLPLPPPITSTGSNQGQTRKNNIISNTIYDSEQIDTNPILINDILANRVYLMERSGSILYEWNIRGSKLGNDATLLPDGSLLTSLKAPNALTLFRGVGGILAIIDPKGNFTWKYDTTSDSTVGHHDLDILPNGNIMALIWEKIPADKAGEYGYKLAVDIYPEKIIEINPKTNEIVWEWRSLDHVVQDLGKKIPGYGNTGNPGRIDINYFQSKSGAVMHTNGLVYDSEKKLIYLSVNSFSEVWVLDHSTTTEEARGAKGGVYGRGGDIVYRFGNPSAYKGSGKRLFYNNHHPSFTESGTFLIFSNADGQTPPHSVIYELALPELSPEKTKFDAPEVLWSYTNDELYHDRLGGVARLENGNTLITEGDGTIWEVTPEKELVWKYSENPSIFWRSYSYGFDHPGVQALGIKKE